MRLRSAAGLVVLVLAVAAIVFLAWRAFRGREEETPAPWTAVVRTVAGTGAAGVLDDPDPFRASFSDPFGVAIDSSGNIFVTDAGAAQRIRRISPERGVVTIAGGEAGFADGTGAAARFDTPSGISWAADGSLLVADTGNNAIRRVTQDGHVTTIAGDGVAGYADGPAGTARFNGPIGLAVSTSQRVIVADAYNDRIRAIEPGGPVVTIAGDGQPGNQDGPAAEARFNTPCGVAVDDEGNIYVADTGNDAVRVISPAGIVSTIWTSPPDGLYRPTGIAVTDRGVLYVTDERGAIVEIPANADARVLAGSRSGFRDGAATDARFRAPSGIAIAGARRLIVADRRNAAIRTIAAPSLLPLAPSPPRSLVAVHKSPVSAPLLWPFVPFEGPHEITGTLGEARGTESERLHAGLDVHAVEGTVVHAVRPGAVLDPIAATATGTLSESLRIGTLTYVHLRVGRERRDEPFADPRFVHTYVGDRQLAQTRVKRGSRFRTGEPIGTVNRFSHVHLNVGWPGEEVNPLERGLVQFEDTVPPTIARGGIRLFREDGQPLSERRNRRLLVSGRVRIVVDAWDQANGNARRRRLGVYRLGYQILNRDGTAAPGFERPLETIRFDRLSPERDAARAIYWSGSGIPEYGRRSTQFLYVVTNRLRGGVSEEGVWDAGTLLPGDYVVRVLAADINGNEAIANRDLPVRVGAVESLAAGR